MSELVTPEIARRLNAQREQLRITQSEIARALKTSQTTVQKILIGEARKSEFVRPMWKFLGLPMEELAILTKDAQATDAPVHPAAMNHKEDPDFVPRAPGTPVKVAESKFSVGHYPDSRNDDGTVETTVIARERVVRMFGVHFGWTQPSPASDPEIVMRIYHADGSVRSYVIDDQLRAVIVRAMATKAVDAVDGAPQS